jgi:hypothetical protein
VPLVPQQVAAPRPSADDAAKTSRPVTVSGWSAIANRTVVPTVQQQDRRFDRAIAVPYGTWQQARPRHVGIATETVCQDDASRWNS